MPGFIVLIVLCRRRGFRASCCNPLAAVTAFFYSLFLRCSVVEVNWEVRKKDQERKKRLRPQSRVRSP